jgi:hypothetical protein
MGAARTLGDRIRVGALAIGRKEKAGAGAPWRGRSQAKRRWKMEELKEFVNATILGIYDRREFFSYEEREELIR